MVKFVMWARQIIDCLRLFIVCMRFDSIEGLTIDEKFNDRYDHRRHVIVGELLPINHSRD